MTPEQERKLDQVRTKVDSIHLAVTNLANNFASHVADDARKFGRHEDMLQRARKKVREIGEWIQKPREKAPSLSSIDPDDSGRIDLPLPWGRASFVGRNPVRLAVALVVSAALITLGVAAHAVLQRPAQAATTQTH